MLIGFPIGTVKTMREKPAESSGFMNLNRILQIPARIMPAQIDGPIHLLQTDYKKGQSKNKGKD